MPRNAGCGLTTEASHSQLCRTQRTFLTEVNGVPTVLVEGRGEGRCYCKVDPQIRVAFIAFNILKC